MKDLRAIFGLWTFCVLAVSATPRESRTVPKPLQQVYSQIARQSQVPALIPPQLLDASGPETAVCLSAVDESGYEFSLDMDPECLGSGATHVGSIRGALTAGGVTLKEAIGQIGNDEPMVAVMLSGGRAGIFQDARCGANCSDSTLGWDEGHFRFFIQMKAGAKEDLIALANAGIGNWIP